MSVIHAVLQHLEKNDIAYSVSRKSTSNTCPYRVATILLSDVQGMVILAYPQSHGIDLSAIRRITHRKLEFAGRDAYRQLLGNESPEFLPPLGSIWGIPTMVEKTLYSWPYLELPLGERNFVRIDYKDYRQIFPGKRGFEFSHVTDVSSAGESVVDDNVRELLEQISQTDQHKRILDAADVYKKLKQEGSLPVMPGMIQHLLRLMGNPEANVSDLVSLIEQDQALSARLIKLARSPHYVSDVTANSVYDAVYRVVGYDNAMRVSLAMIFSRQFQGPLEGRVGMKSIWEQALALAIVARYIVTNTTLGDLIRPGVMYAAALLHNVGYLALSHLFPREYSVFNQLVTSMSDTPLRELESSLMDIRPHRFSVDVLSQWLMPEEVVEVASYMATREINEISSPYVDCMCIAEAFSGVGDLSCLSGTTKRLLETYQIDGQKLAESLRRDNVAAEVPFLSEVMLG